MTICEAHVRWRLTDGLTVLPGIVYRAREAGDSLQGLVGINWDFSV